MTNKVSRRAFGAGVLATGLIGKAAPSLAQGEPKRGGTLVATWGGGEPQACYVPAGGGLAHLLLVQAVRAVGQPPHGRRVRGRAGGSVEARRRLQVLHDQDPQGREVPRRQGHDRRRCRLFDRRDLEEVRRRLGADRLCRRRGAGCRHRRRQVQQAGSRILLLLAAVRQRELRRARSTSMPAAIRSPTRPTMRRSPPARGSSRSGCAAATSSTSRTTPTGARTCPTWTG